jgi:hypothetical protein
MNKLRHRLAMLLIMFLLAAPSFLQAAQDQKTVESETGFYYTIRKGDTLWDLSQKFSDTPWQWPEMWKENQQIANPHRIYPGQRIRLYRRHGTQGIGEGQPYKDKSDITKLLEYYYASIERVGFIRKEPVLSHGSVFKVEGNKTMISTGDMVYIRPENNHTLMPGQKYTIYRTLKPIVEKGTDKFIGIQHVLAGAVEITIKRPEFVLGRIVASYRPIKVGDLLMPFQKRLPRIKLQSSPDGMQGKIIGSEEHRVIFGESDIAFIDKGEQDGVRTGQLYWIYKQEKYRINPEKKSETTLTPVLLGELIVLHTEKTTSTVTITDSRDTIQAENEIITPFEFE